MTPRLRTGLLLTAVVLFGALAGQVASGGRTVARLSGSTNNSSNSFSVSPDFRAPTASPVLLAESPGNPTYVSEVLADSPLGYWRLGEASGTVATDSSPNARNGTYAATYTLGVGGAINALNTAAHFNTGSVDIASTTLQPTSALTVEAWVKQDATCGNCAIFDKSANGGTNSSFLMWEASGQVKCRLIKGGTQYNVVGNTSLVTGVWSHVACTWDGSTIKMYIDNVVQTQTTALTPPINTGTGYSRIGRLADGTYPMTGSIDEVAVYGTGLSAARIAAHYNAAIGGYPDAVRQCHDYYAYAVVTDSGNPASGVSTVTANLNNVSAGQTAVPLVAGSYPLQGVTYGYRSAASVATSTAGAATFDLTSVDAASNSNTQTGLAATVVAANAAPVAAVFLTGLEQGVAATTAPGVFTTVTGAGVAPDAVTKRNGNYSLKLTPTNAAAVASVTLAGSGSLAIMRFAVRLASLPSTTVELATISPSAGNAAIFVYDSATGKFGVRWGAGTIVAASAAPVAGTWYVIELKADFGNPHTLTWRIDNAAQTTASSTETAANATGLSLGTTATNVTYTANFDDVIVSRTGTDYPIGNGKVLALLPNGMGTHNNPTSFQEDDGTAIDANTWNRLDEIPANSSTDYIKQISNGNSRYIEVTLQDTTETCISAVGGRIAYHSAAGTTNTGKASVFDGATESVIYSGDMTGLTNPLGYKLAIVTAPTAGWSSATVNALVFRVGYSGDTSPNPYWDALMVEYNVVTN